MSHEKYVKVMGIIALTLSVFAFLMALVCMIGYIVGGGSVFVSLVMLPLLIICVFVSAATCIAAFINFASRLGKIAFLFSLSSIVFIIVSFVLLYR